MSEQNNKKRNIGGRYFLHAMWIFAGLGVEVIYAFVLEPWIYGHSIAEFTTAENLIHWAITCITWLFIARLVVKSAMKELGFSLVGEGKRWTMVGIAASVILVGAMVVINFLDVGSLKVIHEFQALGVLKFTFQHIYYLCEVLLFTLIIIFGQHALEHCFQKKNFPYGGILVGLTWGLAHWITKGSLWIGLGGMLIGFLFGAVYCLLERDFKKTYIVLALAFIL